MATTLDPFASQGGGVQLPNGGWVDKNNPAAAGASTGGNTPAPSFASYSTLSYDPVNAPAFTAPTRKAAGAAPVFNAPKAFAAPTQADMIVDPSYQWRFNQGQSAAERAALRAGTLRTGNALADLVDYGQNAASQEYQNMFNRAASVWDRGLQRENSVFDAATGTWKMNQGENQDAYNADVQGAQLSYAPRLMSWQAAEAAKAKAAEANFDRSWQNEVYNRDNTYRTGRDAADDAYRWGTWRGDDAYRTKALDQNMEQFLISEGNY